MLIKYKKSIKLYKLYYFIRKCENVIVKFSTKILSWKYKTQNFSKTHNII